MRGKPATREKPYREERITPADAGKTLKGILIYGNHWDHPRGCGENLGLEYRVEGETGSPPRMRGKLGG